MIESTRTHLHRHAARLADGSAEHEAARTMLQLLDEHAEDAFRRHTFSPGHFTASAFILSPDRHDLLLIHHAKLDRWLQPGGHIEFSDTTPWTAALREVAEEVGIPSDRLKSDQELFDIDVHTIPASVDEPAHTHFDLRFLFTALSDEVVTGDEVKDARWWRVVDLAENAEDASVRRAARKLAFSPATA